MAQQTQSFASWRGALVVRAIQVTKPSGLAAPSPFPRPPCLSLLSSMVGPLSRKKSLFILLLTGTLRVSPTGL